MRTTKEIAVYGDGCACCPWLDHDTYMHISKHRLWVGKVLGTCCMSVRTCPQSQKQKLGMEAHICNPRDPERKKTGSGERQASQPSRNSEFQAQWEASLKTESTWGRRLTVSSDLHMWIHAMDAQPTQRTSHCNTVTYHYCAWLTNVKLFKNWNEIIVEHTCIDLVSRLLTVWRWWISYCNVHVPKTPILQSHKYLEVCLSSARIKDGHIFIWSYLKSWRLTTLPKWSLQQT